MDFRLSAEEETLRQAVERFVRDELVPLEAEFAGAPDIFAFFATHTKAGR